MEINSFLIGTDYNYKATIIIFEVNVNTHAKTFTAFYINFCCF